jgi:hydroxymethylbilane synthase
METQLMIFATRPSALARWQTQAVIRSLQQAWPSLTCHELVITTRGDRILDRPLPEIGGKGLFTQELEAEILSARVQAAVHSLKDLPVEDAPGLVIGAVPERAEVRDALVSGGGYSLDTLPQGARLGTSSLRRAAQLLAYRPDLRIEALRGNVDTRLRKVQEGLVDAAVLAGAGLVRLGLENHVSQWLSLEVMLPAPGQGALAVQCLQGDPRTLERLSAIEHLPTRLATRAERAFLSALGGGCSVPVAAYAVVSEQSISLQGLVASLDGRQVIRCQAQGSDPILVGQQAAAQALAMGAGDLLAEIGQPG